MDNRPKFLRIASASIACAAILPCAAAQPNPWSEIRSKLQSLQEGVNTINAKLDALPSPGGMVPFAVEAAGGLCDSAPSPSSNPVIVIDAEGTHLFVVTSVLIKTAPQASGQEGYTFLSANSVQINGTSFDTRTGNLMAAVDGWGVQESADLMGAPVRIEPLSPLTATPRTASPSGGNFPHQIVANSAGTNDVRIELFCRADTHPLSIATVRVSGWRSPQDTINVHYQPGS